MIEKIKTYKTSDGELFDDKKEAEKHELELQKIKIYRVYYHPDIVNITLHFFLKDVRSMLPPAVNHSIAVS